MKQMSGKDSRSFPSFSYYSKKIFIIIISKTTFVFSLVMHPTRNTTAILLGVFHIIIFRSSNITVKLASQGVQNSEQKIFQHVVNNNSQIVVTGTSIYQKTKNPTLRNKKITYTKG